MKITLGWLPFVVLETIALVSAFTWELTASALGPVLWRAQLYLLMPGSILVGRFIEKFLWNTGLSLRIRGMRRDSFAALLATTFSAYDVTPSFAREERLVSGDFAFERGWDTQRICPCAGGEVKTQRHR